MNSTTGTTLSDYLEWLATEAHKKDFGEVGLIIKITAGKITDVDRISKDHSHFPLSKK